MENKVWKNMEKDEYRRGLFEMTFDTDVGEPYRGVSVNESSESDSKSDESTSEEIVDNIWRNMKTLARKQVEWFWFEI